MCLAELPSSWRTPSGQEWAAKEYDSELRSETQQREERAAYEELTLNADQQIAFDAVKSMIDDPSAIDSKNVVFVDGPAGTGKTFLYRKVLHYVRMTGRIALAVAFSGIAALLLPGGRTAHSRFRLPVPIPSEGCCCNVKAQFAVARLLRDAAVIVWDEAPMCHKEMVSAVDKCLQELLGCSNSFGGKIILLGGDWRQIPPVTRYVERDAVSAISMCSLPFWKSSSLIHCRLTKNMRAREDVSYADFCKVVGDGLLPSAESSQADDRLSSACISLPPAISAPVDYSAADLLAWVYDGFTNLLPAQMPQFYESRCVLAPTNEAADTLNAQMYCMLSPKPLCIARYNVCARSKTDWRFVFCAQVFKFPNDLHALPGYWWC